MQVAASYVKFQYHLISPSHFISLLFGARIPFVYIYTRFARVFMLKLAHARHTHILGDQDNIQIDPMIAVQVPIEKKPIWKINSKQ